MHQHIGYEGYPGKTKAFGKYPTCLFAVKRAVPEQEKHEVGYAKGSHVIMCQRRHHTNKLPRGQVSCQAVATKMTVRFDLVRAGQNVAED